VTPRIHNADIHFSEDYDLDDLVDAIEGSRIYIPAIYVVNKIDQITLEELEVMDKLPHYCPVCAFLEWNLDGLVEMVSGSSWEAGFTPLRLPAGNLDGSVVIVRGSWCVPGGLWWRWQVEPGWPCWRW
jgi:C-terminal region of MMR_HSR1 domain